jgi:hypothetical protein
MISIYIIRMRKARLYRFCRELSCRVRTLDEMVWVLKQADAKAENACE